MTSISRKMLDDALQKDIAEKAPITHVAALLLNHFVDFGEVVEPEPNRPVLAFVGSKCGIPSPVADDDGNWNGYAIGDQEDCVLCALGTVQDPCLAVVIDWQIHGNVCAERLINALERLREVARDADLPG